MFAVFFATRLWGGDEDYSSPTRSRRPLAYTAYLNKSVRAVRDVDGRLRPRDVAPQAHRAQAAILNEGSCCRTATSTWPSMPTLKNKKICEDVPPQLDLGPRPSFDSAHLDVPSDQFIPVSPAQNGVKMINEPPTRLLRLYSNLYGIRISLYS